MMYGEMSRRSGIGEGVYVMLIVVVDVTKTKNVRI